MRRERSSCRSSRAAECYATRGLWVSRDGTTITSDGACIVSLGLGPVRLHSIDGDPIAASAVFFVNRSKPTKPAPVHITISNLRIVVPEGQSMYGVAVFGHEITLSHLDIGGSPKDDITISGRGNGNSYAGEHLDPRLDAQRRRAQRDLRHGGHRAAHRGQHDRRRARLSARASPRQVSTSSPTTAASPRSTCASSGNTISDNAGPGIMLELEPNDGPAVVATALEISGNTILRNSAKRTPPKRAGIVLAGGQDGDAGTLLLRDNVIRGNGGPGILKSRLRLVVDSAGNDITGNETA